MTRSTNSSSTYDTNGNLLGEATPVLNFGYAEESQLLNVSNSAIEIHVRWRKLTCGGKLRLRIRQEFEQVSDGGGNGLQAGGLPAHHATEPSILRLGEVRLTQRPLLFRHGFLRLSGALHRAASLPERAAGQRHQREENAQHGGVRALQTATQSFAPPRQFILG